MKNGTERGSALLIALVVVIMVIGIAGAFLADTLARSQMAHKGVQSDEAQLLCEAALEKGRRALFVYRDTGSYDWNQILADHAELSIDPDAHWQDYLAHQQELKYRTQYPRTYETYDTYGTYEYSYYGMTGTWETDHGEAPLPGEPDHFLGVTSPFAEGAFMIVIRDNDDGDDDPLTDVDGKLLVYVTGSLPDGSQRQIEALVEYLPADFVPNVAILVDGSLKLNGAPEVQGAFGSVHANSNLDITGAPIIAKDATTSGTLDVSGTPEVGGELGQAPYVPVPEVQVGEYRAESDYFLRSDGWVESPSAGILADGRKGWNGFKYVGGKWDLESNVAPMPAAYYCETDLKISGSPSATATFFVEGSLLVTGNPSLQPFHKDLAVIVSGDLKLSGTPAAHYMGFYYAYEQLMIGGNPRLTGACVAKNAQDVSNVVTAGSAVDPTAGIVIGNPIVTYDGGLDTGITTYGSVQVRAMTRLK